MPKEESQIFKIALYYFLLLSSRSLPRKQLREDEPSLGRTHSVANSPLLRCTEDREIQSEIVSS